MASSKSPRHLEAVLRLMTQALKMLDRQKAPGHIVVFLDMAVHRLRTKLQSAD